MSKPIKQLKADTLPMGNIQDLAGILADKAIKGKTIDEIIAIEEEAAGDAVAEKYAKLKIKNSKLK